MCRSLEDIPPGLHWFCPVCNDDEEEEAFDDRELRDWDERVDEMPESAKRQRSLEAKQRADMVIQALQILAFRTEDRVTFNNWFAARLDEQLRACSYCIKGYHRRRKWLMDTLAG